MPKLSHLWSNSASHIILCFPIYSEEKKSGISLYIICFLNHILAKICAKNKSFLVKYSQSYYFVLSDIWLKKNLKKSNKIKQIRDFFIYNFFLNPKLANICAKTGSFVVKFCQSYYFVLFDILSKIKLKQIENKIRDFIVYNFFFKFPNYLKSEPKMSIFVQKWFHIVGKTFSDFIANIFQNIQANLEKWFF